MSNYIPRIQMPQIDAEYVPTLLSWLGAQGIQFEAGHADPSKLHYAQATDPFDYERAKAVMHKSILVSSDWIILDGNHRARACGETPCLANFIRFTNLDFASGVVLLNAFPHSYNVDTD